MNIFTFRSDGGRGLFAFASHRDGRSLPPRHGPWTLLKKVQPDRKMPHALDRDTVEASLRKSGFQMWRLKDSEAANATVA